MQDPLLATLPPEPPAGDFTRVQEHVRAGGVKVVVLDDDPTGTQTMHGIDVLAGWTVPELKAALRDPRPCFYVLTNTRSLPQAEAAALCRTVARNLVEAARRAGVRFSIVSRSDSTLRGHFAAELGAIEEGLGRTADAKIVIPAFFEGGRYTIGNRHYVAEGERLVPAADTEFARDKTFGYRHSDLTAWIEEKTGGAVSARDVICIGIGTLRAPGGAESVRRMLSDAPRGAFVVVNAAAYCDLDVFVHGLLRAEELGRSYLFRTAASFVRVRAGIGARPLLGADEIVSPGSTGGLVVVGSYVGKTTAQLEALLALPSTVPIELVVDRLGDPAAAEREVCRVAGAAQAAMGLGRHAVVFTSRALTSSLGAAGDLAAGRVVSRALVEVVRHLPTRPRLLVAKGGITSCDIAIHGLGMRRALVLGQAIAGVPVWEMGPETRFPGLRYVVWPGNVGGPQSLAQFVASA